MRIAANPPQQLVFMSGFQAERFRLHLSANRQQQVPGLCLIYPTHFHDRTFCFSNEYYPVALASGL